MNNSIKLLILSIAGLVFLPACETSSVRDRHVTSVWGVRSADIDRGFTPYYQMVGKAKGSGCVTNGKPEAYTFYSGIQRFSDQNTAESIAYYNALQTLPDADVLIYTTTHYSYTNKGKKVCADVNGLAVKITKIEAIKPEKTKKNEGVMPGYRR